MSFVFELLDQNLLQQQMMPQTQFVQQSQQMLPQQQLGQQ